MPGKWIKIDSPAVSAVEVAENVLHQRMQYVEQKLPLAAHEYLLDVEHVHQLRVGCRRAEAALQAFRPLISDGSKSLKKWLRQIRRAAGPARDLDVLLDRMKKGGDELMRQDLVERLQRRRSEVQPRLLEVEALAAKGKLSRSVERCLDSLRASKKPIKTIAFTDFANAALRKAGKPLRKLVKVEQFSLAELHQLRLAGKRLRYSIELFHGAFPHELRSEIYPLVEKLQNRLGRLNDHVTAQSLFQSWLTDMPANEIAAYLARRIIAEHEAANQLRSDFVQWWTRERAGQIDSQLYQLTQIK